MCRSLAIETFFFLSLSLSLSLSLALEQPVFPKFKVIIQLIQLLLCGYVVFFMGLEKLCDHVII